MRNKNIFYLYTVDNIPSKIQKTEENEMNKTYLDTFTGNFETL